MVARTIAVALGARCDETVASWGGVNGGCDICGVGGDSSTISGRARIRAVPLHTQMITELIRKTISVR